MVIMIVIITVIMVISDIHYRVTLFVHVLAEYMLLHILHLHHSWWSYVDFAGRLYGCNRLITSGTSYLAKTGDKKNRIVQRSQSIRVWFVSKLQ